NGTTNYDYALARFNPDGTPDTAFGWSGVVVTPLPTYDVARSVAIQPDGKIVVAGSEGDVVGDTDHHLMVMRYNPADGSLDTAFGVNGVAVATGITLENYSAYPVDVALEPDGRIIVAGTSYTGGTDNFSLARFLAAGPEIGSFRASPNPVTAGSSLTLTASNIIDEIPSASITQVAFYHIDTSGNQQLLGSGTQTSPGVWTFTFTVTQASGSY